MKKLKLILFIVFVFSTSLYAKNYPISPRPLRQLVLESDNIIIGYVVSTFDKKTKDSDSGSKIARVAIIEQIQGKIKKDTLELTFNPNMICPAPAMYYEKTFVISFLKKYKGEYTTYALNYGAKTLKKNEIEIYKKRIFEIQNIIKIDDEEDQFTETIEWLVKCSENEITRWEGTFELSPESDFMSFYSRESKIDFKSLLSLEQKNRLKKALLSSTNSEYVDFGLVDLVYVGNEKEIEDYMLKSLKVLNEDNLWIADGFINRLKHKKNTNEVNKIIEKIEEINYNYEKVNEKKELIKQFIIEIEK